MARILLITPNTSAALCELLESRERAALGRRTRRKEDEGSDGTGGAVSQGVSSKQRKQENQKTRKPVIWNMKFKKVKEERE